MRLERKQQALWDIGAKNSQIYRPFRERCLFSIIICRDVGVKSILFAQSYIEGPTIWSADFQSMAGCKHTETLPMNITRARGIAAARIIFLDDNMKILDHFR